MLISVVEYSVTLIQVLSWLWAYSYMVNGDGYTCTWIVLGGLVISFTVALVATYLKEVKS